MGSTHHILFLLLGYWNVIKTAKQSQVIDIVTKLTSVTSVTHNVNFSRNASIIVWLKISANPNCFHVFMIFKETESLLHFLKKYIL